VNLSALGCLWDDLLSLLQRVPGVNMSGCDAARLYGAYNGYMVATISPNRLANHSFFSSNFVILLHPQSATSMLMCPIV